MTANPQISNLFSKYFLELLFQKFSGISLPTTQETNLLTSLQDMLSVYFFFLFTSFNLFSASPISTGIARGHPLSLGIHLSTH